jgi:GAF domain-containing protein
VVVSLQTICDRNEVGWSAPLTDAGLRGLAEEQAALRRVATLVARGLPATELFRAVTEEVGRLLSADYAHLIRYEPDGTATALAPYGQTDRILPAGTRLKLGGKNVTTLVFETGRSARIDDYGDASGPFAVGAREHGARSSVAAPVVVEDSLWGVMVVGSSNEQPLPPDTEARLGSFTELVATAIANAESRAELARLAEQQAALRRVATLVARDVPPEDLFASVTEELARLLLSEMANLIRYESDGTFTILASVRGFPVGSRWPIGGKNPTTTIFETGRPARSDGYGDNATGPLVGIGREAGLRSTVAVPIIVEGRLWGAIGVGSTREPSLPPDTESRLADFTELVATAIANAESHAELARLAEQQAALRRVATLVARGPSPEEVFLAVTNEIGLLLAADMSHMLRYDADGTFTIVARAGVSTHFPVGSRWPLGEKNALSTIIFETGRPGRINNYADSTGILADEVRAGGVRSSVAAPIIVEGRVWGLVGVSSLREEPPPADTEERLASFTELVATAIANAESRARLARLAEEQAALRRVATLVAQGAAPEEVFAAVANEVGRVLSLDLTYVGRYESDGALTFVASPSEIVPVGSRWPLEDQSNVATLVFESGRSARIDDWAEATGPLAELVREAGVRSVVGTPIIVEGRLWGVIGVATTGAKPLPADTEARLSSFTELVATAIANAESRAGLARLAEEQEALRRVATLVARGVPPGEVFAAVTEEVDRLLLSDVSNLCRLESDGTFTILASAGDRFPVGSRWPVGGKNVTTLVFETGRSGRIDNFVYTGPLADDIRGEIRSAVGAPIIVDGRLWGALNLGRTTREPSLPPDTEARLGSFTELVAMAIANAESRAGLARLAEEQAALGRVATLVAEGAAPAAVFDAVAAEMATLLVADGITLVRYEPGDELTLLAHRGSAAQQLPLGTRLRHDGVAVSAAVRRTKRPARMTSYADIGGQIGEVIGGLGFRSGVGAPIVVDGRLWGATIANWTAEEPPPTDTEERMAKFARLLGTAIANADSRDQLTASRARLVTEADEARRRVVRDLHDGAQQRLLQTIVTLGRAQRALEPNSAKAQALIAEALAHARQGNSELRELAHGILPAVLIQGGLRSGISSIVTRLDLPVEVDVPRERFPAEVEASAYFVVAEGLTNVVKHAQAERAEVRAWVEDGMLRVEVRDDGVGGADPSGQGLVGLSDRVTAIGGDLVLESPESGGTLLTVKLPVSAAPAPTVL